MVAFAAIAAAFIVALQLRARKAVGLVAIPIAALLVPLAVAAEAFVYPAHPEVRMWWQVAAMFGTLYGLAAAALGYALAAFTERRRGT